MATNLGKAYVQIMPSAQGIKQAITNELSGASNEAGEKAGLNIIGKIKGAIAAAGIGAVLKSAISEGAELEQSIGGIETLYKDAADQMKEYAAEAYKTAGISANDYMQQATSFAAGLVSSLNGDTAAAAEAANQALIDMADNANKMGTPLESIQNAYAGFAKQNYTMLDNLKLGYGGTKSEMERLLARATEISKVEYDIDNLADVYNAIHVIQENLDITGTTAKEAASTISGSLASMQGAFKNLLGNITTGGDVSGAMSALVETATTFLAGNLVPALGNIVMGLPAALGTFFDAAIPQLAEYGKQIIDYLGSGVLDNVSDFLYTADWAMENFIDDIAEAVPDVMASGVEIVNSLVDGIMDFLPTILDTGEDLILYLAFGIADALPSIIEGAGNIVTNFVSRILEAIPNVLETGKHLIRTLSSGIAERLPDISRSALSTILKFVATVGEHLPEILKSGITIIGELIAGLISSIPDIVRSIPQIIDAIKTEFSNFDWKEIGSNIVEGIKSGLLGAIGSLTSAAKDVASQALSGMKNVLGIHSPSAVFRDQIGQMIDLGLAAGISDNSDVVLRSIGELGESTTNGFDALMISNAAVGSTLATQARSGGGFGASLDGMNDNVISAIMTAASTIVAHIDDIEAPSFYLNDRDVFKMSSRGKLLDGGAVAFGR